ncbi:MULTISPECIES: phosphopantetheine-binding protein [unclassified Fusibacter]|uniref:phosphopantetheine-binding protein n=1 Tax=unclassified Fusibacter TaxID=2624464 RepID=UPI0013E92A4D|nr:MULTISPECIES: phosphopantetheine-binding protein [unclassified Fusibacter]MCK8060031.1 phosphopantetheine-binding protein [Fusibacter sp. A2]NPE22171.1 acyl carrier protein [Fusibacter sp. A1]
MSLKIIRAILAERMGYSDDTEITSNLSLFDDLEMNGNDFDETIAELEERFDIEFDDDDIDGIEYVSDLVKFVKKHAE